MHFLNLNIIVAFLAEQKAALYCWLTWWSPQTDEKCCQWKKKRINIWYENASLEKQFIWIRKAIILYLDCFKFLIHCFKRMLEVCIYWSDVLLGIFSLHYLWLEEVFFFWSFFFWMDNSIFFFLKTVFFCKFNLLTHHMVLVIKRIYELRNYVVSGGVG